VYPRLFLQEFITCELQSKGYSERDKAMFCSPLITVGLSYQVHWHVFLWCLICQRSKHTYIPALWMDVKIDLPSSYQELRTLYFCGSG
jgi:hypothetical protein